MKGFRPPEYTQTPNRLFDELLPQLGYAELKVLLCLFRATFGWHRPKATLSIKQIAKATGLSAHHAWDAGDSLEKRGFVKKVVTLGVSTEWEVLFEGVDEDITLGEYRLTPVGERGSHPATGKSKGKEILKGFSSKSNKEKEGSGSVEDKVAAFIGPRK